ncbi:MAG: HEAT repeat domain-containing protein [Elusimicrobia bacterium]|nr:HEAT repeat domain-containing protein [Elusimicrobiota bacterium]
MLINYRWHPIFFARARYSGFRGAIRRSIFAAGFFGALCWAGAAVAQAEPKRARLRDADPQTRLNEAGVLGQQAREGILPAGAGDEAVGDLSEVLSKDADKPVRRAAAHALARFPTSQASNALAAALEDPDPQVRLAALTSLIAHGSRAIVALQTVLSTASWQTRLLAVDALGEIDDPAVVPLLTAILERDGAGRVRVSAAQALGKRLDTRAVEALSRAAQSDPLGIVRQSAASAAEIIQSAPPQANVPGGTPNKPKEKPPAPSQGPGKAK